MRVAIEIVIFAIMILTPNVMVCFALAPETFWQRFVTVMVLSVITMGAESLAAHVMPHISAWLKRRMG